MLTSRVPRHRRGANKDLRESPRSRQPSSRSCRSIPASLNEKKKRLGLINCTKMVARATHTSNSYRFQQL